MDDHGELEPDGVVVEVAEGEVLNAGLLGAGAVQAFKLDRVVFEGGEGGQGGR